ncbi:MAG TPA: hypothetical protein VIG25_09050 [Pyrinomonadaceae bacterium]|jgi:hypothetical protein
MKLTLKTTVCCCLLSALSLAGPLAGAKESQAARIKASAIQVMMIRAEKLTLPAEFQVSLYEQLINQLQQKGTFSHVYRDGDRNAAIVPDLIALQCTVVSFKQGSETMRQVTTVAGATSITLRCQFRDRGGNSMLERDITGKVRFVGGNLRATYDFAKKAASAAGEKFSAAK